MFRLGIVGVKSIGFRNLTRLNRFKFAAEPLKKIPNNWEISKQA